MASNSGVVSDSVGGGISNGQTSASNGSHTNNLGSVPTAGYDNNVEKSYGEKKETSGVKKVMNKISEKMDPGLDKGKTQHDPVAQSANLPGQGSERHAQANADLNRE